MHKLARGTIRACFLGPMPTGLLPVSASAAASGALQQGSGANGLVSIEVEEFDHRVTRGDHTWKPVQLTAHFRQRCDEGPVNTGNLIDTNYVNTSPLLDFKINFVRRGVHPLWVRGFGARKADDSLYMGLDEAAVATNDWISGFKPVWGWSHRTTDGALATINVKAIGIHVLNAWMREDRMVVDKLVLTTNPD
jgi:hypothetical protein